MSVQTEDIIIDHIWSPYPDSNLPLTFRANGEVPDHQLRRSPYWWVKLFLAVFKKGGFRFSLILFADTSWILNPRIVQDCSYSTRIRAISVVVLNSWSHCRLQNVETDFVECGQTTRVKRARTVRANCRWLWFVILHVFYIDGCFNNYLHVHVYGNVALYCVHVYTNPNTIYPELTLAVTLWSANIWQI